MKIKTLIVSTLLAILTIPFIATDASSFETSGFSNPFGIAIDSRSGFIYVSSMQGKPNRRDGTGYISRLKGDGAVDKMRFINGTSKKFVLNAPKGMAIADGRLYVTDIDKLHAFDLKTGKFLFDVNFGDLPVQHFYDISMGPDRALYLTDGPANIIYRIDVQKQHEVTIFIKADELGQPHSITWYPAKQVFAIAGWSSGKVTAFDRTGKRQTVPAILLRTLEGIVADDKGNMYVSSSGLSAIYRIAANFGLNTFKLDIRTPMGVAFNPGGNEILVASFENGTVKSISLADEGERSKAATVTDYVQQAPKPDEKPAATKDDEAKSDEGKTEKKEPPEKIEKKAEEKPAKAEEKKKEPSKK